MGQTPYPLILDIDMMVGSGSVRLSEISKVLIMEQILIGVFDPEGNKNK